MHSTRLLARCTRRALHSCVVVAALTAAGCAGTAPRPEFSHTSTVVRLAAADAVEVSVTAAGNAQVLPEEQTRLAQKIKLRIDNRKLAHQLPGDARNFELDLQLSRYQRGNAFARAMLAGLGQIHIEGKVRLYQMPAHELVTEFDLAKTFAWGGIYGASTSIEDIENSFADGVAAAITDEQPAKPKQGT
ncbi:MAG TPA: hypothetical protein VM713_10495 [Steroidobacteraceae bacterium]|nr:hypothetical protein [Steroidobacteraceae bacterium]